MPDALFDRGPVAQPWIANSVTPTGVLHPQPGGSMRRRTWFLSVIALALLPAFRPASPHLAAGKLVPVKMTDISATQFKFDPAEITVNPGDTVRFVQSTITPHNVDFRSTPAGANLGAAKLGPFLTAAGQNYDLVIDARFSAGTYQFVCTPHEMMGMKGVLTVAGK
jgi:plastocyanin